MDIIILTGLSQGVIFSIVLIFGKTFKDKTNRYLAFSIIIISIIGFNEWAVDKQLDDKYYLIDFLGDDIPWIQLVFVPAFIYFKKSLNFSFNFKLKNWFLTIPFLFFLILNVIIDLDIDFHAIDIHRLVENRFLVYQFEYYLAIFYTVLLCIATYGMLVKSTKPENIKKWLNRIWLFYTTLIIIWIVLVFIPEKIYKESMDYIFWIAASFFIYWLIYKGMINFHLAKDISSIKTILTNLERENSTTLKTSKKKGNTRNKEVEHIKRMKEIIEIEHLYRNPDVGLHDVAERMQLSPNYLSQLINANLKINFTGMINNYRVEEVKKLIADEAFNQYSLLSIGLEAGFKSKSAFYSLFKKETGLTPNEYKNKL